MAEPIMACGRIDQVREAKLGQASKALESLIFDDFLDKWILPQVNESMNRISYKKFIP